MKLNNIKVLLKNKSMRPAYLILCSLLISGNAISRNHWNRTYFDVWNKNNTLEITAKVFDYNFGPRGEKGYLKFLFCEYSKDGVKFYRLMTVSTGNQKKGGDRTWVDMKDKLHGAKIKFCDCIDPPDGTLWTDNKNYRLGLFNWAGGNTAWVGVSWDLQDKYKGVRFLRISATWRVKGILKNDEIHIQVYPIKKIIITPPKSTKFIDLKQEHVNTVIDHRKKTK